MRKLVFLALAALVFAELSGVRSVSTKGEKAFDREPVALVPKGAPPSAEVTGGVGTLQGGEEDLSSPPPLFSPPPIEKTPRPAGRRARKEPAAPVNLKKAGVRELIALPGIGPKRAALIVALREDGRLRKVEDLLEVKGIGKKTLARLRPYLKLEP